MAIRDKAPRSLHPTGSDPGRRGREAGTASRDARSVERQAVAGDISHLARFLQDHLGQRMTAYLSGIRDPKMVGQWAAGKVQPRPLPSFRLRSAYQAARYLVDAYGDETARAWFFGMNPSLDDEAPAYVLRHGSTPDDWRYVVAAAKEFVETAP